MRKIFILVLMVLVGIGLFLNSIKADEARTITHKFRAFTTSTSVGQGHTIFRITGYASGSTGIFGIYNVATYGEAAVTNCAVEGGEATSGDPLPLYDFGPDGLNLDSGMSVVISNCTIVVEYI